MSSPRRGEVWWAEIEDIGPDDGMPSECAASFDNLRVVPKAYLVERQCTLDSVRLVEACRALRATVGC